MTANRQPAIGETWTVQSCMRHGPPIPATTNWTKFPVILGVTMVSDAWIEHYAERVECGCMDFGEVPPRLHRAEEPTTFPVPDTPIESCASGISIAPGTDMFQCELPAGHRDEFHQARRLGHNHQKVEDYEGRYYDLDPDVVVYVRWKEFDSVRDEDVEWHPD